MSDRDLAALLDAAVGDGVFPGCVALVWREGAVRYRAAHGQLAASPGSPGLGQAVTPATRYDLASLTKVLATATLAAQSVGLGKVTLDDPLPEPWRAAAPDATFADLLEHAAGLEAHRPFFVQVPRGRRSTLLEQVAATPRACGRRERAIYSDLGFLLLGAWLEQLWGARLDELFERQVAPVVPDDDAPLPVLAYRPVDRGPVSDLEAPHIAPTEVYDPSLHEGEPPEWFQVREDRVAHGWVHDDNTYAMNGIAGHAGLFGTADAVLAVARAWLEPGALEGLDESVRDRFWAPSSVPGSTRRLGWDGTSPDGSGSTHDACGPRTVGHLGFTGTSLWIDPDRQAIYVLLSNRVHPTRHDSRIKATRRAFHRVAARL